MHSSVPIKVVNGSTLEGKRRVGNYGYSSDVVCRIS